MIGDAFLEKADDRHHPIPQKGRDARPIGLALCRGREPKGNRHIARSPGGALVLSMFLKPNVFLAGDAAGRDLR